MISRQSAAPEGEGVKNEHLDVIGQSFTFPENIPGAIEENMAHPSMVENPVWEGG